MTVIVDWLARREWCLPAAAALAWWALFYPGFISEDSLITLNEARAGNASVVFTAWWVFVVDALTLGTRAIPMLTLINVMVLEYAAYWWMTTVLPKDRARAVTVLFIAVSPMVAALGIQIRRDAAMTSGLLLCAIALTRTWAPGARFSRIDFAALALAVPLVSTRQNSTPTLIATAVLLLAVRKWRHAAAIAAVAVGAITVTYAATRAAGHTSPVDSIQAVDAVMADISCLLSDPNVAATEAEWAALSPIASRNDWPQEGACWYINPMLRSRTFNAVAVPQNYDGITGVWLSLASRYPLKMAAAHAKRVRMFLPPFAIGIPHRLVENYLHSTILPNDFGLAWKFPALAERARIIVRAWNAASLVLSHAGLWLIVLLIFAWRGQQYRVLLPTCMMAVALDAGLVMATPVSEGRYGLFILICGQAATMHWLTASFVTKGVHRIEESRKR